MESLFLPLDLADRLRVRLQPGKRDAIRIVGDTRGVPADGQNLALRAARGFLGACGRAQGVAVELEKRVPAAGGLGGGSSDAAAVLRALAALCPGALPEAALSALALRLGADVPFFLDPRPALVRGIGEQITPLQGIPALSLLLVHPGVPLSTARVFRTYATAALLSLTPPGPEPTIRRLLALQAKERPGALRGLLSELLENDLEPAAAQLCPSVAQLREEIQATGALAVGMSGSGPTLYGVYADRDGAERARKALGPVGASQGARSFVANTMSSALAGPVPPGRARWGVAKW